MSTKPDIKIISARDGLGKNNGVARFYTLESGDEYTVHGLVKAYGLEVTPQTLARRIKEHGFASPKVFGPVGKKQGGRGKGRSMSIQECRNVLKEWNAENKAKITSKYIEIDGYEPIMAEAER